MDYLVAVREVMLTVEDTRMLWMVEYEKLNTEEDKIGFKEEMKKSFGQLKEEYIVPAIIDTFRVKGSVGKERYPRYKEGVDDVGISETDYDSFEQSATENWLKRKEEEINEIKKAIIKKPTSSISNFNLLSGHIEDAKKPRTIVSHLKKYQIEKIYTFLKEEGYIKEDRNTKKQFLAIFSVGDLIPNYQIKWLKGIDFYHYFFIYLEKEEYIHIKKDEISSILKKGDFFVNAKKGDKSFGELKNRKDHFDGELKSCSFNSESPSYKPLNKLAEFFVELRPKGQ